jgi:hypothetical protein
MNKQWIYRNGERPFSVTEIVMPYDQLRYVSVTNNEVLRTHYSDGQVMVNSCNIHDLIPYEPYADFKIDDKVNTWDDENGEVGCGHFAGLDKHGKATTFYNGGTSFTRHATQRYSWNFCEKANKEDK